MKEVVEKKLHAKEKELADFKNKHEVEMNALERKFLEEKNRMNKEHEQNIDEIRRLARRGTKGLTQILAGSSPITDDGRRIAFQLQATDESHQGKTRGRE